MIQFADEPQEKSNITMLADDGYEIKEFVPIPTGGRIGIWQKPGGELRLSLHTGGMSILFGMIQGHLSEHEYTLAKEESDKIARERFSDMANASYRDTMFSNTK